METSFLYDSRCQSRGRTVASRLQLQGGAAQAWAAWAYSAPIDRDAILLTGHHRSPVLLVAERPPAGDTGLTRRPSRWFYYKNSEGATHTLKF